MRIFSVHSLQIPNTSMDVREPERLAAPAIDKRKRVSIPVPMPDFLRTRGKNEKVNA